MKNELDLYYNKVLEKRVKERVIAGFTQNEIGQLLDISESGYFKEEKGKTKLDLYRLLHILQKLEISPDEFFKDIK
mgnify:CR=1 FL=1